jgi:hypothetical protein
MFGDVKAVEKLNKINLQTKIIKHSITDHRRKTLPTPLVVWMYSTFLAIPLLLFIL